MDQNTASAEPSIKPVKSSTMLNWWLRESFKDAPYNLIDSAGSGMIYSHEHAELVDCNSSSLACETGLEEHLPDNEAMIKKKMLATSSSL